MAPGLLLLLVKAYLSGQGHGAGGDGGRGRGSPGAWSLV
uniref:Uncharacterized protein n=1 Tax=Arundo donax TaxID=35708 RepID=A0A0A8YJ28_ARUDO